MVGSLVSSKDITTKYKIPYSTLSYYTNMGFLNVVKRKGNKRFYDEGEVRHRLKQISDLVNKGYPLRLIRNILFKGGNIL